jgi:hypothetical protein
MDETQAAVHKLKHGDISGLETLMTNYQVRAVRTAFLILQVDYTDRTLLIEKVDTPPEEVIKLINSVVVP